MGRSRLLGGSALGPDYNYSQNWVPAFLHFLSIVKIFSKELPEPSPITPYGGQLMFLREVDQGLSEGQHSFSVLKARQLGISTIMLALDLFWLFWHPGLQGALIADEDKNTQTFRETITMMLESLPPGFRIPTARHNRNALILANGSRLQYLTAGKKKNPDLGRSRGLNFVHASEISSWGDQDGIHSLIDALATENPNRLYIFESTAKGYNAFHDVHKDHEEDPTKRAMFIGWWAKELYRIRANSEEFERWWGVSPVLTEQEAAMAALIEQDYGVTVQPEQWAWWRKQTYSRSEQNLLQEFPWHERVAFQVTGSPFFSLKKINEDMQIIQTGAVTYDGYKYDLGDRFLTMQCLPVTDPAEVELRIYEPPIKGAKYAIGVDVAYGRNAENDRHCIEVFRCFADKMIQVAEWTTNLPESRHVAWVLAHLAGSYRDCMINLEVSGPGLNVMTEMKLLRQDIEFHKLFAVEPTFDARQALSQARWFLYHRPDTPGQGYMYNWKTNHDNKQEMFNGFRDAYSTDQVIVRSSPLLNEMTTLVQNGVAIQASARNKDDRPFAAGLACYAWRHWIRLGMMHEGRTFDVEMRRQNELKANGGNMVSGIIPQFFAQKQRERSEAELQRLIDGN